MKKKLFLSIVALFAFSVFLIRVNAATTVLQIGWDIQASAPTGQVSTNKDYYGTISKEFDFSKVVFAKEGGGTLNGKTNLEKIIIGELKEFSKNPANTIDAAGLGNYLNNYFTAYCLNEDKKYPAYGLFNLAYYYQSIIHDATTDAGYFDSSVEPYKIEQSIILANIMNDTRFSKMLADLESEFSDPSYIGVVPDGDVYPSYEMNHVDGTTDYSGYFDYFMGRPGAQKVDVGFRFISFNSLKPGENKVVIYCSDQQTYNDFRDEYSSDSNVVVKYVNITGPSEVTYIPLTGTLNSIAFQKYKVSSTNDSKYNHALWIIENSYPTISIDALLKNAGIDKEDYVAQIKALYSVSDEQAEKYTEMVTYGIIQYAVWRVIDSSVVGEKIGASIQGDGSSELNKLFQYLIRTDRNYSAYANPGSFSGKINISKPKAGKELKKQTDTADIYGPYKASYRALVEEDGEKITYTIANNEKGAIKIVNSSFQPISNLSNNQEFYIWVSNKEEISNVKVSFALKNVTTFDSNGNRAKIFTPLSAISQDAIIGGKTAKKTITGSVNLDVVSNPKTGLQNIVLLLTVTLVAFTLGYLVLSAKQKPIQLQ